MLLIFPQADAKFELLRSSIVKLGWSVCLAQNEDDALELFHAQNHELVVVDRRKVTNFQQSVVDDISRLLKEHIYKYNM